MENSIVISALVNCARAYKISLIRHESGFLYISAHSKRMSIAKKDISSSQVNTQIGKNIRIHRSIRGLTLETVGKELGLTYQQVQKYESGKNAVSIATLLKLAIVFQVPIDTLLADLPLPSKKTEHLSIAYSDKSFLELLRIWSEISDQDIKKQIVKLVKHIKTSNAGNPFSNRRKSGS